MRNQQLTVEEVWAGINELRKAQKETDRQLKESRLETDRRMEESKLETDRRMEESRLETDRQLKESYQEMKESKLETDRQLKKSYQEMKESRLETDRQLTKLERSIDKVYGDLSNKWGKFMEQLVGGDLVNILKDRGIEVSTTSTRVEVKNPAGRIVAEFDLLAVNGDVAVVIEVKTKLDISSVYKFIKKLKNHKDHIGHTGKAIYGGVAFLELADKSNEYAMEQGLFVIRAPGGESKVSVLTNPEDFRPKAF